MPSAPAHHLVHSNLAVLPDMHWSLKVEGKKALSGSLLPCLPCHALVADESRLAAAIPTKTPAMFDPLAKEI